MANEFNLSNNAISIFKKLYCFQNENISDTFTRVAKEFATNDEEFQTAYDLLAQGIWRPNTPVFMNAGTKNKIFGACFVTGLEDSMDSIYETANLSRKIFQRGAGVGIPIGNLRERDSWIFNGEVEKPPEGKAGGPIRFMRLFDAIGDTTWSGGRTRRAAILCCMHVWHPDILDFIRCKQIDGHLKNMNISVLITDKFMRALQDKVTYPLISPYNGSQVGEMEAEKVWDAICTASHKSAEPGILFYDEINRMNPLKKRYLIESTNPCIAGDTEVLTNIGKMTVQELANVEKDGLKIMSFNEQTQEAEWDDVVWAGKTKENTDVLELEIEEDGKIYKLVCTPDHEIYTRNRGYVKAKNLSQDDDIVKWGN